MENLEDFVSGPEETATLGDFTNPEVSSSKALPVSAVRNRAATLGAISGAPDGGVEIFSTVMQENEVGITATADSIRKMAAERSRGRNYQYGVLPALSDVNANIIEKQKIFDEFASNNKDQDSLVTLASDSVIDPSPGETNDSGEARLSVSQDLFSTFQKSYSEEQAIINNFRREQEQEATASGQVLDIAQQVLVPVGQGISAYSFTNELRKRLGETTTFGDKAKAILRPGASYEEVRRQYEALSGEDRISFVQILIDTIKDTKGVIFSTDSQFDAMSTLEKVVGDYSPADATFDTVTNALDIIGVGFLLKKGVSLVSAAGKVSTPKIVEAAEPLAGVPFEAPRDIKLPVANPEKSKLDVLYRQKEELIADSSGVLPNRSVTALNREMSQIDESLKGINSAFKDEVKRLQVQQRMSRSQAESAVNKMLGDQRIDLEGRKARVQNLLDTNALGQKSQDKIRALDNEISRIEALPDADGIVRVNPIVDAINRADRNSLVAVENPASVGSILYRTNPEKSRNALLATFVEKGDQASLAVYGLPRTEAVASAFVPKQLTESGVIGARPVNVLGAAEKGVDSLLDEVKRVIESEGSVALTAGEQERAANAIMNDFRNPTGIQVFDGMDGFHFNNKDGLVELSSVYGAKGGAFSSAEDAMASTKLSLKNYGVDDSSIQLLKKDGINYVPTTLEAEKGKVGDYLSRVTLNHQVVLQDVKKAGPLDQFKAKANWLDAVPAFVSEKSGSLTRHFLHSAAIFDKHLATAASVADVLTNRLEKVLQASVREIASDLKRLPKKEQDALSAYFVEANEKGLALSLSDFAKRGFTEGQYEVASKWREYWDTIFYLQNKDMKKTLTNNGFMLFDNGPDRFFARPVVKDIGIADKVYDPDSGKVISMSRKDMDDLYSAGGTFARTRTAIKVEGREVEHIVVRNTPSSNLRGFGEGDNALNYRQGYYTTSYKAPIFIDKIDPTTGKRVAVATAKDSAEASQFIKRAKQENPDASFVARPEKKRLVDQKEDVWSLNEQGGMSAQRRRGQPLIEADGSNRLEGTAYFDGPFESAVRASRSIAGRTIFRDVIATAKERAMQKHGHLFPKENGVPKYPGRISDISSPEGPYTREVRNARTDFEYINYLENGYINGLDNMFKTLFGVMAEGLGKASTKIPGTAGKALSAAERGLLSAEESLAPTKLGKFAVFNAYIASAFLRQWFVQPAQLVRMMAYNPVGMPNTMKYLSDYASFLAGNNKLKGDASSFVKFAEDSGFLDSVDKSNLVRGTLTTSGEQTSIWEKTGGKVFNPLRMIGYDLGEKMNILGHSAAVFDRYVRDGKDVTSKAIQHEMIGKIDALSYSMRFSGDMPYNQNSLALFTQFMQVPHKAMLQAFDRRLTPGERTRMVVGDLMIYGGAGAAITAGANALFGEDVLDNNPGLKEFLVDGALQATVNTALNNIMDYYDLPEGELDINGSFSPFEFGGYKKMAMGLLTDGGLMSAISNTPIGGMTLKDGNKVQKAIAAVGRFAGFVPDSEIEPTTVAEMANSIASITTGWSNLQKASLAWEMNKIMTKSGQTLVNGLSPVQVLAQAFGISPKEVGDYYEDAMYLSKTKKDYEANVRNAARTAIEVAVGKTHIGVEDQHTRDIVVSLLMHEYRDKPEAWRVINQEFEMAAKDPKTGLLNSAIKAMAFPEYDLDREKIKRILGPEQLGKLDQWQANIDAAREVR